MAMDSAARVMNGTWGQIWEDGTEIAEVSAFQVKVSKNFDTINICGQMAEDRKLTGVKITGSMTLHKVYSRGADDVEQAMSGHDLRKTLVGKLDDPDAYGAERVLFGTDFPMWRPKVEVEKFLAMPLTEEERRIIAWDNGAKLLHLDSRACAVGA